MRNDSNFQILEIFPKPHEFLYICAPDRTKKEREERKKLLALPKEEKTEKRTQPFEETEL